MADRVQQLRKRKRGNKSKHHTPPIGIHIKNQPGGVPLWDETDREPQPPKYIPGIRIPTILTSIYHVLTTRQSNHPLPLDLLWRVQAALSHLRDLWNDFCLWSDQRRFPLPRTSGGLDSRQRWNGPRAAQIQIGYERPSSPGWRIKQIVEVVDYEDLQFNFLVEPTYATWLVLTH